MRITYQSLKEVVVQRLRQEIFEGVHKPGAHLVEQNLADQYGVSRGPIREALVELEREGLVRVNPRRGATVTELSLKEIWEIYTVRAHLEGLAVKFAANHWTDEHSKRLAAIVADMEALGPQDWFSAIEVDTQFHHLLVGAGGNQTLLQVYETLDSKVVACFLAVKRILKSTPLAMTDRHHLLAEALQRGDFASAEVLAVAHWADTAARLRLIMAEPAVSGS